MKRFVLNSSLVGMANKESHYWLVAVLGHVFLQVLNRHTIHRSSRQCRHRLCTSLEKFRLEILFGNH